MKQPAAKEWAHRAKPNPPIIGFYCSSSLQTDREGEREREFSSVQKSSWKVIIQKFILSCPCRFVLLLLSSSLHVTIIIHLTRDDGRGRSDAGPSDDHLLLLLDMECELLGLYLALSPDRFTGWLPGKFFLHIKQQFKFVPFQPEPSTTRPANQFLVKVSSILLTVVELCFMLGKGRSKSKRTNKEILGLQLSPLLHLFFLNFFFFSQRTTDRPPGMWSARTLSSCIWGRIFGT